MGAVRLAPPHPAAILRACDTDDFAHEFVAERAVKIMIAAQDFDVGIADSREANTHHLYGQMETGSRHGMQTLEQHLARLVGEGQVSELVARRAAVRPDALDKALAR